MSEDYAFRFHIKDSYPIDKPETKEAFVFTKIKTKAGDILFEGDVRVHVTSIGVFPVVKDIASAVSNKSLRQQLTAEVKRYVRPHRNFL